MFGSIKKSLDTSLNNEIETIIGKNNVIKGDIKGTGNVRIDGILEGNISISGCVVIGEEGRVNGDVSANEMVVSGLIEGNVATESTLAIYSTGRVVGDVKVGSLRIDEGGMLNGRSEMNKRSEPAMAAE